MTSSTVRWEDPRELTDVGVLLANGRLAPRRFASRAEAEAWARPDDDDFGDLRLSGFAAEALARLRADASGTGPEADTARDALALLVRFASAAGAAS